MDWQIMDWQRMFELKQDDWLEMCKEVSRLNSELAIARERVNELELVAIEVAKLESDAGSDCPMCLKNHPGHSRQRCDDHCLVVAAKNALAGAEPKSRG